MIIIIIFLLLGHFKLHSPFCPTPASVSDSLRIWETVLLLYGTLFVAKLFLIMGQTHRSKELLDTIAKVGFLSC